MPIYEYACTRCEKQFEELIVRRSDEADVKCPACGGAEVSRRMSRPAATRGGASGGGAPPACGPVG
ncbi:zinc ribbon domain-containing protein [Anaeromyxobacter sp. Fw109-5]|uniref:FmdB family zinc ribbon protein n=1 Tax=Anaeromyxobacter sp. (strain Fw109-5) TaxID=404589 RepID=UPI000158A448|nr:zinc ribbon domain-containing protein [Anaeromyxobacter sp. Fw109-5]ABS26683.1 putative regulatory protein, FmdB family [Anaeromyxobacter sp. Fw109-5]